MNTNPHPMSFRPVFLSMVNITACFPAARVDERFHPGGLGREDVLDLATGVSPFFRYSAVSTERHPSPVELLDLQNPITASPCTSSGGSSVEVDEPMGGGRGHERPSPTAIARNAAKAHGSHWSWLTD